MKSAIANSSNEFYSSHLCRHLVNQFFAVFPDYPPTWLKIVGEIENVPTRTNTLLVQLKPTNQKPIAMVTITLLPDSLTDPSVLAGRTLTELRARVDEKMGRNTKEMGIPCGPHKSTPCSAQMTLDQYVAFTRTMACNPGAGEARQINLDYLALGLCSEAGEVAGKVKKILRGDIPRPTFDQIADEMGDVLWYLVRLADDMGFTPEDLVEMNRKKLQDRKDRQVIKGSGDVR